VQIAVRLVCDAHTKICPLQKELLRKKEVIMSTTHDAFELYRTVRVCAARAGIPKEKLEKADIVYSILHPIINSAKRTPNNIPTLQAAITNLPMQLIEALDVAFSFDDVREAILSLPTQLMDILSPAINFKDVRQQ